MEIYFWIFYYFTKKKLTLVLPESGQGHYTYVMNAMHTCKNKSICSSTLNKKCNLKVVPNLICHLYPRISFTMEPRSKRGLVILISVLAVILILILIITVLLRDQNVVQETEVFTRPQMQDSKVEIMRMYPTTMNQPSMKPSTTQETTSTTSKSTTTVTTTTTTITTVKATTSANVSIVVSTFSSTSTTTTTNFIPHRMAHDMVHERIWFGRRNGNLVRQYSGLEFEYKICMYACARWKYWRRYEDCFQCHQSIKRTYPRIDPVADISVTPRCGYPRYLETRSMGEVADFQIPHRFHNRLDYFWNHNTDFPNNAVAFYRSGQQLVVYRNLMNTICDPLLNNYLCDYDAGDCCTPFTDLDHCHLASNCECHFTGRTHATFQQEYGCQINGALRLFGDGYCHNVLNTPECMFDGGDCCLAKPLGSGPFHSLGTNFCREDIETTNQYSYLTPQNTSTRWIKGMQFMHKIPLGQFSECIRTLSATDRAEYIPFA